MLAGDVAQQIKAGRVRPVQIVQDDHKRIRRGDGCEKSADRLVESYARLFRREGVRWRRFAQMDRQFREDRREDGRKRTGLRAQRIGRGRADVLPERFEEWQIGWHSFGIECPAPEHGHTRRRGPRGSRIEQVRLADPRFAGDEGDMCSPT